MNTVDESNVKTLIARVKLLSQETNDLKSIVMGFDGRIKALEASMKDASNATAVDSRVSALKSSCEKEFSKMFNENTDIMSRLRKLETDPLRV